MAVLHTNYFKISGATNFGKQSTSNSRKQSKAHKENENKPTAVTEKFFFFMFVKNTPMK